MIAQNEAAPQNYDRKSQIPNYVRCAIRSWYLNYN